MVTVVPSEFHGAINNPLKGFRDYKKDGYGLLERQYIKWNDIEVSADDTVERIIAHTNKIARSKGKGFEELNVKLVPRVYHDWNGETESKKGPQQHWPADLHTFDYDSPAFQDRLRRLVEKLGQARGRASKSLRIPLRACFSSLSTRRAAWVKAGRYRFPFRVRGTPGQTVEFELADGWRGVSKESKIPLTEEWREHVVEFAVKSSFKNETCLRFRLPKAATGHFDLTDTRLRELG